MAETHHSKGKKNTKSASGIAVVEPPEPEIANESPEEPQETEAEEEAKEPGIDPRCIPRVKDLPPDEFFAFLAQYPQPSDLDAYIYRLKPVIRVNAPSDLPPGKRVPSYINKVAGIITPETNRALDLDWLQSVRGSGHYRIQVTDHSGNRTKSRELCQTRLEINEWDAHPPIFNDWNEIVPCEANKWFIDKLIREQVIQRTPEGRFVAFQGSQNGTANGSGSDPGILIDKTLAAAERMARMMTPPKEEKKDENPFAKIDIVKLMEGTQKANDPEKILTAARGLAEMMKPPEAPKVDQDGQLKLIMEIAKLFKTDPPPAQPSAVEQMKQTAEMAKIMKEAFGPSEDERAISTKMNGWQEFLRDPLTELINGMKPLFAVGAQFLMLKAQQGNPVQQPQPVPRPAPAAASQPAAVAQQAQPAPAQQPVEEPPVEVITPQQQQEQAEARAILNGLASVMPTMLEYVNNQELTGEDFAGWFCDAQVPTGFPPPFPRFVAGITALDLLKKYPPEHIIELIEMNSPPMFADLVPTPDKRDALLQFIQQFQSFNPEGEPEPVKKGKK